MKKIQVDKELDDAVELFESAHYLVPIYDAESGNTNFTNTRSTSFRNIRRLKRGRADYQPGPIKDYTEQEIEDYVKSKSLPPRD